MNTPVVCFDLDDTLYKERDYVMSGFRAVSALSDGDSAFEVMKDAWLAGQNAFDALHAVNPQFDVTEAVNVYRAHMPRITLDAGAEWLLKLMTEKEVPAFLITDGRAVGQRNKYEALGLERFIQRENLIISELTGHDKHDAENFLAVMERYAADTKFVYVGDNPVKDFKHPNRLGWITIMLRDTENVNIHNQSAEFPVENRARFTVDKIEDVAQLLLL